MKPQCLLFAACCLAAVEAARAEDLQFISLESDVPPASRSTQAVVVNSQRLTHTAQFFPLNRDGAVVGKTAAEQLDVVFQRLELALGKPLAEARVVKLNVYVVAAEITDIARQEISQRFPAGARPAVSFVQSRLAHGDALIAADAVASSSATVGRTRITELGVQAVEHDERFAHAVTLLPKPRVYVSGQAIKAESLREATRLTMLDLQRTLDLLQVRRQDVVQVKCFLTPMSEIADVRREIADYFAPDLAPPCVFVAWQSSLPIEIELIATVPPETLAKEQVENPATKQRPALEFITPPGTTASPVFCRVVRVNDPRTIFIAGLFAKNAADGAGQVTQVFEQLQNIATGSGSDLRHLAKATYYVSDHETSAKLNELRPKYYDPQRPPAASKAQVTGVGVLGRSLTLDMIAVPKSR